MLGRWLVLLVDSAVAWVSSVGAFVTVGLLRSLLLSLVKQKRSTQSLTNIRRFLRGTHVRFRYRPTGT